MKKWIMIALLFTSFTLPAVHEASARVDTCRHIDGVPGEATAKGYENWIVLNRFGHTLMNASLSSIKFGGDGTPQEVVVLVPQSVVITCTPETPKGSGTPATNTVYCGR